jgi:hypothetical protein
MTAIVFNSVPQEDIEENWGTEPAKERARALIREMMRQAFVKKTPKMYPNPELIHNFYRGKKVSTKFGLLLYFQNSFPIG